MRARGISRTATAARRRFHPRSAERRRGRRSAAAPRVDRRASPLSDLRDLDAILQAVRAVRDDRLTSGEAARDLGDSLRAAAYGDLSLARDISCDDHEYFVA